MTNEYSRLFAHFGAQRDYTSELTVNYRVVYCIPSSANILAEGKKKKTQHSEANFHKADFNWQ